MRRRLTSLDVILKAPSVYRFPHQQGLMGKQVAPPVSRRRLETELPNDIWQSDAMHWPMLLVVGDNRRKTYLLAFIDDISRLIVHAEFYLSEGLANYIQAVRQTLLAQEAVDGGRLEDRVERGQASAHHIADEGSN
jgi:putative transposase